MLTVLPMRDESQASGLVWAQFHEETHGKFPSRRADSSSHQCKDEDSDPLKGNGRIVLAEDDPRLRRATRMILEDLGYQVEAYANGDEVLEALETDERPFELLLTDFDMPGLSGYELTRQIRALQPDTRVLLTSGTPEDDIFPSAKPPDWPPFIPKPYSCESLGRKLQELLAR